MMVPVQQLKFDRFLWKKLQKMNIRRVPGAQLLVFPNLWIAPIKNGECPERSSLVTMYHILSCPPRHLQPPRYHYLPLYGIDREVIKSLFSKPAFYVLGYVWYPRTLFQKSAPPETLIPVYFVVCRIDSTPGLSPIAEWASPIRSDQPRQVFSMSIRKGSLHFPKINKLISSFMRWRMVTLVRPLATLITLFPILCHSLPLFW